MKAILEVSKVSKAVRAGFYLKPRPILSDVSFSLDAGKVQALVGPNGAGKTTLLKIIAGISRPTSGDVRITGVSVRRAEARAVLGFQTERPYLHGFARGRAVLESLGLVSGLGGQALRQAVDRTLEHVGLSHAAAQRVSSYSKGMLQRLAVAQALLHQPKLLLLDEPASGLDPAGRAMIRDLVRQLAHTGTAILFSTHQLEGLETYADEVVEIAGGRLARILPVGAYFKERGGPAELVFSCSRALDESWFKGSGIVLNRRGEYWVARGPVERIGGEALDRIRGAGGQVRSLSAVQPEEGG